MKNGICSFKIIKLVAIIIIAEVILGLICYKITNNIDSSKDIKGEYNYILDESSSRVTGKFIKDFKTSNTDNIVIVEEDTRTTSLEIVDGILFPLIHSGGQYEITKVITDRNENVRGIQVKINKRAPIY